MANEATDANVDDQQSQASAIDTEIDPSIGLLGACAIGVGTMIAAGIFVLSGLAVSNVGAVAILSFLLAAVVAGLTAAAYSEFASIYQESGGGYMYVHETYKSDFAYIMGWTMILGYPASAAFYLASFSDWFYRFIYPVLGIPQAIPYWVAGTLVLALLVYVNVAGTEESSQFQIAVTGLKVALLALFLYGGLQAMDTGVVIESFTENIGDLQQIGLTSALVFITFFGFSAIATNAEEIKSPETTVPNSIYISMGVVTLVYALVVLVVVIAINDQEFLSFLADNVQLGGLTPTEFVAENGEVSMGRAAQYYLGSVGFYVIIVGALFSMLSAANATVLAGSRVKLAMARRDHLPASFKKLHPENGTPHRAVLLTGSIILAYLIIFFAIFGETPGAGESTAPLGLHLGIEGLTQFANCLLILGLTAVNVALISSRRRHPDIERGFRMPLVPYLPIIAIIANLGLLFNVGVQALILGLIAEALGVLFWTMWKGTSTTSDEKIEEETPTTTVEYAAATSEHDYQIVVPIASQENLETKMRTALRIAHDRGGALLVMTVATLPEQTPLRQGSTEAEARRPLIREAMQIASGAGVPADGLVRIGHHAGNAIVNTVIQHESAAVLMGWGGERTPQGDDAVMHQAVDRVVAKAPCDVFVEYPGETATPNSILVPIGGGRHGELSVETAGAIARETGARVRIIRVVAADASERDREKDTSMLEERAAQLTNAGGDLVVETDLVRGDRRADTIVEEAEDVDLVVIGAAREGLFRRLLFGALSETVSARLERQTVLMVKSPQRKRSRAKQSARRIGRLVHK